MKAYIVTLWHMDESVRVAERASDSADKHGLVPEFWAGVPRDFNRAMSGLRSCRVALG